MVRVWTSVSREVRMSEQPQMSDRLRRQIDQNFEAFSKNLDQYMAQHRDKYALMRDGAVTSFFLSWQDAYNTGNLMYDDAIFSVQKVTRTPVDLGFFSRV